MRRLLVPFLLPLWLGSCAGRPDDGDTGAADADGDGFDTRTDCDDSDPGVRPGVAEVCNGRDDDCDGVADGPTSTDAPTWYADADGDGFGAAPYPRVACAQPEGHVDNPLDCDDSTAAIAPGADELCNEADDDCDGAVDEDASGAPTWYADADADGYGDPAAATAQCSAPAGAVSNDDDCDDGAAAVRPGADEVWYDGVDQDCDGSSDFDADGDGFDADFAGGADCADDNPVYNPDRRESCNGIDEDCDGIIDDDAWNARDWFQDADGDGYGDPAVVREACASPGPGWVSNRGDCNDADATIRPLVDDPPGDGIDQDCDGVAAAPRVPPIGRWG